MPDGDAPGSDRGETLVELMMTVLIVSVTMVALVGAVGVSVRLSDLNRRAAAVSVYLRAYAEALTTYIATDPTPYVPCAAASAYDAAFTIDDPTYVRGVTAIRFWNGTTFGTACNAATESGVQRLTLEVQAVAGDARQSLEVIIRRPCRPTPYYSDTAC